MDDSLRRLEREARARTAGERRPVAEARSAACELCGGGGVRWGTMCEGCRDRLRGRAGHPAAAAAVPAAEAGQPGMSLIQNVPGAVYRCLLDTRRTILFVTHQITDMTGRPASELTGGGAGIGDLLFPADRLTVAAAVARARPGEPFEAEYRIAHLDGSVRWVHDRGRVVGAGGRAIMDGVLLDVSDRRRRDDEMAWLALHDPLTMLPNRRALDERLALETARRERTGSPLSAVAVDLDHFKRINDAHGHDAGDRALIAVADRLRTCVGDAGLVARAGGEEFVMLLPGRRLPQAFEVAEAARAAVETTPVPGDLHVTISAGVAEASDGGEPLLVAADTALYRAKRDGRNRVAA